MADSMLPKLSARFEVGSGVVKLNFYERIVMKSRFIVIAMGLSLGISAARGTPTLFITEFPAKPSFTFDHFVATFNGAPASFVTIELTSAHAGEQWTITFSDGWTLDLPNDMRFDVEIGEPEGGKGPFGMRLENFLTFDFGNQ